MKQGLFITIEGLDGSGKSTQAGLLVDWLRAQGIETISTHEPGGTPLGKAIRGLVLEQFTMPVSPLAELFLFHADRAQHFDELILPSLRAEKCVVSDYCYDVSIVYQGYVRGLGMERIEELSLWAMQGRIPDCTILLDYDPVHLTDRLQNRLSEKAFNRLDQEKIEFYQKAREGFLLQAAKYPERINVIDALQSIEQVHADVLNHIQPILDSIVI